MASLVQVSCALCCETYTKTLKQVNQAIRTKGRWACVRCMSGHNRLELIGRKFGRLLVVERLESQSYGIRDKKSVWLCRCECGSMTRVTGSALNTGKSQSCGCAIREATANRSRTHGMTGTRTYRIWQAMHNRCRYPTSAMYHRYGGRGIKVCERWSSFEAFLADMGECPPGSSIDRVDNDADYDPENCRWADRRSQARNTSRNRFISFNGERKCLKEWAESLSMDQASLAERIEKWGVQRALSTPKGKSHGSTKSMSIHRQSRPGA